MFYFAVGLTHTCDKLNKLNMLEETDKPYFMFSMCFFQYIGHKTHCGLKVLWRKSLQFQDPILQLL